MSFCSRTFKFSRLSTYGTVLGLALGLIVVGCDSETASEVESASISGQVTDDRSAEGNAIQDESAQASASTSSAAVRPKAGVEGAVVTATAVQAQGTTNPLEGEATTDADGSFTITVEGEGASEVVRLEADGEVSTSTIAQVDGRSSVQSQPMTTESDVEAEVYLEAKAQDGASVHSEGVTTADVALYVNPEVAADIRASQSTMSDVAAAITSSVEAESRSNAQSEGGIGESALADAKADAYSDLQSGLGSAGSADARTQTVVSFENAMSNLYVEAGGSEESQAESRQASTSIMIEFSAEVSEDAELGLRRQAELLRAEATARAQEAIFEAQGASQTTLDALASARQQLQADIRTATSTQAMVEAKNGYEAEVKSEMESTFEISSSTISKAETEIGTSVSTLFGTLADLTDLLGSSVDTVLNAYDSYYVDAEASASSTFKAEMESAERAEAAAKALVYLSVLAEE